MALTRRYFSYTDPVTGNLTKGYGHSVPHIVKNVTIKRVNGAAVVVRNESVRKTTEVTPANMSPQELTEQEFNALDVSGESLTSQLRREKELLNIKKLEAKLSNPHAAATIEEVLAAFEQVNGI